jgi:hypothetical protein
MNFIIFLNNLLDIIYNNETTVINEKIVMVGLMNKIDMRDKKKAKFSLSIIKNIFNEDRELINNE